MADSVETFLDEICKTFAVSDGGINTIRSFLVFERNELPEAVSAETGPCAVSFVTDLQVEYSMGGPTIFYWQGQTEFHLTRDISAKNVAHVMRYFGRIAAAAMQNMKLGGRVEFFTILQGTENALQFVTYKNPVTGQDDHQGIVVRWSVKQPVSGQYLLSA